MKQTGLRIFIKDFLPFFIANTLTLAAYFFDPGCAGTYKNSACTIFVYIQGPALALITAFWSFLFLIEFFGCLLGISKRWIFPALWLLTAFFAVGLRSVTPNFIG